MMRIGFNCIRQIKHCIGCRPISIIKRSKSYEKWLRFNMGNENISCRENPLITKLDTLEFHSIFTPELNSLIGLFKKYKYEIRVAGGAVRDILMQITPQDLDFATTATPEQMKEMFTKEEIRMINAKGEKHGTITARINDKENFEITTLRVDRITDGRHAEVEFTTNWKVDANRRDLTINSMFLDFEGNIYDYFYGYDDLNKHRVAFVGDVATRLQEDYLRILRYFRFYGKIASEPDNHEESTLKAITQHVSGLERISGERIWAELYKILEGKYAREIMNRFLACGTAKYIGLPENPDVENFNKVYLRAQSNNIVLQPITLISTLLKDQEEVMKLHMRLKFSVYNRELLLFIVQHREDKPCEKKLKPYQHIIVHYPKGKTDVVREYIIEVLKYRGDSELLKQFEEWVIPRFPINGNMIRPLIKDNVMIGLVTKDLKDIWLDHNFQISSDELVKFIPNIVSEIEDSGIYVKSKNK